MNLSNRESPDGRGFGKWAVAMAVISAVGVTLVPAEELTPFSLVWPGLAMGFGIWAEVKAQRVGAPRPWGARTSIWIGAISAVVMLLVL